MLRCSGSLLWFVLVGCATSPAASDATDALAWYCRGAYHEAAGDYQIARDSYHQACALDPAACEPTIAYARTLLATDDQAGAMDVLEGLIEHSPHNVTALSYLAELTFRRGLWSKAIHYNAQLLRERPNLLNPAHHLRTIWKRGDQAASILVVLSEVSIDPRASPYLVETVAELTGNRSSTR